MTTNINISEQTTTVTTVDDVTTITLNNTGLQGASYDFGDPIYVYVTNKTGVQLNKGAIVYVSGANGVHTQVSLALATGDVTSARTLGWLAENIANNATGLCMVEGYLDGVDTQGVTEGAQLYLSPTVPGGFQETKPSAPEHMVYVGVCSKASAGNGRVFVKVQNGAELEELHDVKIVSPQNNDLLRYVSGTALWENVAATAVTVGSAITAGTATYSTTSGSAVTITGTITNSQVSDFASGTVANISGTVTQAQVANLTTDLAGKANLVGGNSFTGAQIVASSGTAIIPMVVRGTASQSGDLTVWQNSGATALATISSLGYGNFTRVSAGSTADLGYAIASINTGGTANKGLVIRGVASQSADLLQFQNSSGGTVAFVQAGGNLKANNVATFNSRWQATENAGGGLQIMTRATAAASNPGANAASLYFRDGTNAGTLKLVVRAGAAGAETTILDNIPT